jgi:cysteine-rich repeat protein
MYRPLLFAVSLSLGLAGPIGCHVAGCAEGDAACAQPGTEPVTEPGSTSTGESPTSTGGETSEEPSDTTTPSEAVCGNGVVEAGEACDDGNADDTDACVGECEAARCGDGLVQFGVEACDDANAVDEDDCTNACLLARCGDGILHAPLEACDAGPSNSDSAYDGCTTACQPGPRCGDGKINGPETCDDQNNDPSDGCLEGCFDATSCLQILESVPTAGSGVYTIWPEELGGNIDVSVWCDMDVDGGGYTFLKVDTQVMMASDKGAAAAETLCQAFGMHLLVTRSEGHALAAYQVATTDNITPVGGGNVGKGSDYLAILAIFPAMMGATCEGMGLNSDDCPGWRARDDQRFWVTETPVPDEPSSEHCDGCSMLYKWNLDGTLKSYTTFPAGEGAGTYRFLCDTADKV